MPAVTSTANPFWMFDTAGGQPLVGGLLYSYQAGTSNPLATYTDSTGSAPNTNPIVLNARGETSSPAGTSVSVWCLPNTAYKFILTDAAGNTIDTIDNYFPPIGNLTTTLIGSVLYPQTAAEAAIPFAPVYIPKATDVGNPRRYGCKMDGITDDTVAMQLCYTVLGATGGGTVKFSPGDKTLLSSDILVPTGPGSTASVNTEGSGWNDGGIIWSGNGVTHGLYSNALTYGSYAGSVRKLRMNSQGGAIGGVAFVNCNEPAVELCKIFNAAGAGISFTSCDVPGVRRVLLNQCGSSTAYALVCTASADNINVSSTDLKIDHVYIQGNISVTNYLGGIGIDYTSGVMLTICAVNSQGPPVVIGGAAMTNVAVSNVSIDGLDLENPGNGNPYLNVGAGSTGTLIGPATIKNLNCSPSGTTSQTYAVQLANTSGWDFQSGNYSQAGTPTATFNLVGTNNAGTHIFPHWKQYGFTYPWVQSNGAQVKAAGPRLDWQLGTSPRGFVATGTVLSGATPSILQLAAQGGFYGVVTMGNGGATTVSTLSGGEAGMEITLVEASGNANTTLTNGSGAGQFLTHAGANLVMAANQAYHFVANGNKAWVQV